MSTNETGQAETPAMVLTKARESLTSSKGGRPTLLTPEVHAQITARVRVGAFMWVASGACGIPYSTFAKWMVRGQKEWEVYEAEHGEWEAAHLVGAPEPLPTTHAAFWFDVRKAAAMARAGAEAAVMKDNPLAWLTKGPGRHRGGGEDGWTDKLELAGTLGVQPVAPQQYDLSKLPQEKLDVLEALLLEAASAAPGLALGEGGEGSP